MQAAAAGRTQLAPPALTWQAALGRVAVRVCSVLLPYCPAANAGIAQSAFQRGRAGDAPGHRPIRLGGGLRLRKGGGRGRGGGLGGLGGLGGHWRNFLGGVMACGGGGKGPADQHKRAAAALVALLR
jgi:hypothetical protein